MTDEERIEQLEATVMLQAACLNDKSLDALAVLITELGSCNDANPWLGVCAGVALLKREVKQLRDIVDMVEWVGGTSMNQCPICSAYKSQGHLGICTIGEYRKNHAA